MSALSDKALQIAISQIGQDEKPHGSNWGEPVKTYLHSVGIDFPASWCMGFVYWCYKNAASELGIDNPAFKSGGVLNVWNNTPASHKATTPSVGSIFIMDFGHGLGHTGIVERFDETFIYSIDGNTNDTGSREGIEVCRRKRARNSIKGYINI
jgi:hypothetical protein